MRRNAKDALQLDAERKSLRTLISLSARVLSKRANNRLKPFLRKAPPDEVMNILRLGIVEIAALEAAAHGVVSDMVAAAGLDKRTFGLKGMVNAVLRRATEQHVGNWGKLPIPRLPDWLRWHRRPW